MGFLLVAVILLSPGFSYSSVFSNPLAFADEDERDEDDRDEDDHNENENNDKNSRLAHLLNRINDLETYLKQIEENKAALEEFEDQFSDIDWMDADPADPAGHFGRICNTLTIPTLSCPVASPTTDTQTFGLRDDKINGENQAFLLRQSLIIIGPPVVGGEMESSDFAVLAIAGMKDNAFNILGILSLVGISTFAALYFTVKRK